MEGINESNILEIVKELCDKTNALMSIYRNKTLPFLEEKFKLPYICESCLQNKLLENKTFKAQMTFIEAMN